MPPAWRPSWQGLRTSCWRTPCSRWSCAPCSSVRLSPSVQPSQAPWVAVRSSPRVRSGAVRIGVAAAVLNGKTPLPCAQNLRADTPEGAGSWPAPSGDCCVLGGSVSALLALCSLRGGLEVDTGVVELLELALDVGLELCAVVALETAQLLDLLLEQAALAVQLLEDLCLLLLRLVQHPRGPLACLGDHLLVPALGLAEELVVAGLSGREQLVVLGLRLRDEPVPGGLALADVLVVQALGQGDEAGSARATSSGRPELGGLRNGLSRRRGLRLSGTRGLRRTLLGLGLLLRGGLDPLLRGLLSLLGALGRGGDALLRSLVGLLGLSLDGCEPLGSLGRDLLLGGLGGSSLAGLGLCVRLCDRGHAASLAALVQLVAQLVALLDEPAHLSNDLVEEVVDLPLVVPTAELGGCEVLVEDILGRERHVVTSVGRSSAVHSQASQRLG